MSEDKSNLQQIIGYEFKDKTLLQMAMTHKSYHYEAKGESLGHNEKLEFLGDAVLDLVVSETLMRKFPQDDEGNLSKKRASLVNETVLAKIGIEINLPQFMLLGKGELLSGGEKKPRLVSSAFEAVVGALFLDGGFEPARDFLHRQLEPLIAELFTEHDYVADFKTRLQEMVQAQGKAAPSYRLIGETGPSHLREFEVEVQAEGLPGAQGIGRSKKSAEQEAARAAIVLWKTDTWKSTITETQQQQQQQQQKTGGEA